MLKLMSHLFSLLFVIMLTFSLPLHAQEILTIESQVTGSKEQPKVITIVPWKDASEPDYYGDDVTGLDENEMQFQPINRASFIQEVQYIKAIRNK